MQAVSVTEFVGNLDADHARPRGQTRDLRDRVVERSAPSLPLLDQIALEPDAQTVVAGGCYGGREFRVSRNGCQLRIWQTFSGSVT